MSPADECVCLLSDPARVSGIKSEGMQSKREAKALVERNDYATTMDDVPPLRDFKVILCPQGTWIALAILAIVYLFCQG